MSDRARISEFTADDEITADDILYLLRNGSQDISLDVYTAIRALIGIAVGKSFKFDGTTATRLELDGLNAGTIRGLTMAWVSTTSFSVATGFVGDSTFADTLALRSSLTKTTSAWAVGTSAGGLDAGTIAANTWYAVYVIKRPDTGVVDVLFSTSATSPTLPANYTLFRRVGWILTNGSSQFVKFFQVGRKFWWDTKVVELNAVTPASTNRILKTVTLPINVEGMFIGIGVATTTATNVDVGWTALADNPASTTNMIFLASGTVTGDARSRPSFRVMVDANRQIYYRCDATTGTTLYLINQGWIDDLTT